MIKNPFILASASPRRQQILTDLGVCFSVRSADIDESVIEGEGCADYVSRLARQKSQTVFDWSDGQAAVLGSDTCVVINQKILGKPESLEHSIEMLMSLSGRWHDVLTAVSVRDARDQRECLVESKVLFATLNENACRRYWATGEPCDKAGSYAIQGKGGRFVKEIKGSYSAIVGLPVFETAQLLAQFNIPTWDVAEE
ncbi:MAG: septum formation inhibitor Maf [Oceanospirillaceae bacterium]|nr:septum formation inhibitor Maf [Oceanospirillaceae bacterium]